MSESQGKPESRLSRLARMITSRPHLVAGAVVGILAWVALDFVQGFRWSTRSILAWDIGSLTFMVSMMLHMVDCTPEQMSARSARQDEGQGFILTLVLVACVASLASVAAELGLAKDAHGLEKSLRVGLAALTVAGSWFMVQLIFALHYAHEFYSVDDPGGLRFPGETEPDYWDFIHFSVVIGTAAQTADIEFTSQPMRRIGTIHSLIAFTFNTVVLALSINLLAALL